jgi:hypothetical protein
LASWLLLFFWDEDNCQEGKVDATKGKTISKRTALKIFEAFKTTSNLFRISTKRLIKARLMPTLKIRYSTEEIFILGLRIRYKIEKPGKKKRKKKEIKIFK